MADLITLDQWTARTGRTLTSDQAVQVSQLITDASALVVDIVGDSDTTDTWDASTAGTVPGAVVPVVVAMVRRGLDRPYDDTGSRLGDYQYSGASGSGVFASRQEAKIIRKAAGKAPVGALNLESDLPDSHRDPGYASWLEGSL